MLADQLQHQLHKIRDLAHEKVLDDTAFSWIRDYADEALRLLKDSQPCTWCDGKGYELVSYVDPTCGNCDYGDCDYGHDRQQSCTACEGTGRRGK